MCSDSELCYEECLGYIDRLRIPDGYEIDVICITGADSMTEAYNAAMESSDAKYKIYLHQDVFIYYKGFVEDILKIFQSDDKLGMLGVVGGVDLPHNAVVYNAWNRGCTFWCSYMRTTLLDYRHIAEKKEKNYEEVEAVDGMLIATQYDIWWREDLKLGWDFYDISQSMEFRRRGYRIGVPFQETPWCMHDCGSSNANDRIRRKILEEYSEFFPEEYIPLEGDEYIKIQEQIFLTMKYDFDTGRFDRVMQIKKAIGVSAIRCNNLRHAILLTEIYEREKRDVNQAGSFFYGLCGFEEMKEKYERIKFIFFQVENGINIAKADWLRDMIKRGELSREAVWSIGERCVRDKDKFMANHRI